MKIDYILTAFSPSMFGDRATAHIRRIDADEAVSLVSEKTKIMASRVSHERLARLTFQNAAGDTARYAILTLGKNAIHLHYRGPQVPESGEVPVGGTVNFYLIEVSEYQEPEDG